MAENSRAGRTPFERIKVVQDFCGLDYGAGDCNATRTNLFPNSSDITDGTNWNNANATIVGGKSDPLGGTDAFEVTINNDDFATDAFNLITAPNIPKGTSDLVWYMFYGKFVAGSGIDEYLGNVTLSDDSLAVIRFNITNGTTTEGSNGAEFDSHYMIDVGGGWYRGLMSIQTSKLKDPGEIRFNSSLASLGDKSLFFGPQATPVENQQYVPTSGQSKTPVDDSPCYNTRVTCQDPDNYTRGTLTVPFTMNDAEQPSKAYNIPSLDGVNISPATINPGGANKSISALGRRATISASFIDHAHNDRLFDKYLDQRAHDPLNTGTLWTKWRARNPYYMHRPIIYESGYIVNGQVDPGTLISRTFFITGFSGPDGRGNVRIEGKDALTLAENDKAKAPFASLGKLSADIGTGATSATLTPTGIGNSEYPGSGHVRIGKEVMAFTRSGDNLALTRAQYGTESDEHDQDDTVQLCLVYDSAAPADILFDLLSVYAKIPGEYLDKAQWDAEQLDYLPRRYSAIISEPEGVSKLVAEMCEQMHFTVWFDDRDGKVYMRSVRPAENESVLELSDNAHLIEDSVSWRDMADELITQVWVYYGQLNPTEKLDQGDNYAALDVIANPDSEGPDRNNISRIKTVFSRWIDSTNGAAALDLGNKIIARYGSAPRECTFSIDAKDRDLWLADFIRLTNRLRTDFSGNPSPVSMQVYEAQESEAGTRYSYKAQEYVPQLTNDEVQDPNIRNVIISADVLNMNLRQLHDSQYAPPTGSETVKFIIRGGVTVGGYAADGRTNVEYGLRDQTNDFYNGGTGSVSGITAGQVPILQRRGIGSVRTTNNGAAYPGGGGNADFKIIEYPVSIALDTGSWPGGVTLELVVESGALILGEGGNGSTHGLSGAVNPGDTIQIQRSVTGGDGGHALRIRHAISVTNGGVIASGGGGGALAFQLIPALSDATMTPGGGGAGLEISDTSTNKFLGTSDLFPSKREPSVGSTTDGGSGGLARESGAGYYSQGGDGGDLASAGLPGVWRDTELGTVQSGTGGLPGDAIAEGANLVTWINKGDVRGAENA